MNNDSLRERFALKTNDELLEIIGSLRNEYQPEAITVAEEELEKRGVSFQTADVTSEEVNQASTIHSEQIEDNKITTKNLDWFKRVKYADHILFPFVMGAVFGSIILYINFSTNISFDVITILVVALVVKVLSILIVLTTLIKWKSPALEIIISCIAAFFLPWITLIIFSVYHGSRYSKIKNDV